jgi:hypothetical protein
MLYTMPTPMYAVKINDINIGNLLSWLGKREQAENLDSDYQKRLEDFYFVSYEDSDDRSCTPGYLVDGQRLKTFIKIPENYKDRFYIEYKELEDRSNKLAAMLEKWRNNSLDFTPSCSYELLEKQLKVMLAYKEILEERAKIENISLKE